jgi:hypothetical protein
MKIPLLLGKESDANIVDGRDSAPRGMKFLDDDDDDDDAPLHDAITTAIPTRKIIDRVGIVVAASASPAVDGHERRRKGDDQFWRVQCAEPLPPPQNSIDGSPSLLSNLHCGGERGLLRNHRNPTLLYTSFVTI